MQVKKTSLTETSVEIIIIADAKHMANMKQHVLEKLAPQVKVAGFRPGKVPLNVVEKNLDNAMLQTEFLDEAVNHMYGDALDRLKLRPVSNPEISLTKFVPFTELEFKAVVETVGDIVLPDYTKIKVEKPAVKISADDVNGVIESLRDRLAERKPVERAAKDGDEVMIDFKGTDDKGEAVNGADGKDYPLILGSKAFIPGFEENIVGMKTGDSKSFTITFPKDYGVSALQSKKVTFEVTAGTITELVKPKVDDDFAGKAGPFKSLTDLKADIKQQLATEKQYTADRDYENEIIKTISAKTKMAIPKVLIDEQIERLVADLQQNLMYRGQTKEEFFASEKMSEDEYKEKVLAKEAEQRVKGGLILSEIAEKEKVGVTPEELQIRLQLLKGQYQDAQMQAELDKPANQRDIAARILTEKTLAKLVDYVSK